MNGPPQLLLSLVAALAVPSAMLFACVLPGMWQRILTLLWIAPMPALAAGFFAGAQPLLWDWTAGRVTLVLDRPGAILLGAAALLWMGRASTLRDICAVNLMEAVLRCAGS